MSKLDTVLKHIDGELPHGDAILTDEHIGVLIDAARKSVKLEATVKAFMRGHISCGCDPDIKCPHDMAREVLKEQTNE